MADSSGPFMGQLKTWHIHLLGWLPALHNMLVRGQKTDGEGEGREEKGVGDSQPHVLPSIPLF